LWRRKNHELEKHAKTAQEIEWEATKETDTNGRLTEAKISKYYELLEKREWVRVEDAVAVHRLQLEKLQEQLEYVKSQFSTSISIAFFEGVQYTLDFLQTKQKRNLLECARIKEKEGMAIHEM